MTARAPAQPNDSRSSVPQSDATLSTIALVTDWVQPSASFHGSAIARRFSMSPIWNAFAASSPASSFHYTGVATGAPLRRRVE